MNGNKTMTILLSLFITTMLVSCGDESTGDEPAASALLSSGNEDATVTVNTDLDGNEQPGTDVGDEIVASSDASAEDTTKEIDDDAQTSTEGDTAPDVTEPAEETVCTELGLPAAEFLPGTGSDYGKIAGFFSAETLKGTWKLDENWTGCETFVFINYTGDETFWGADISILINKTAPNTHYFFSGYGDPDTVKNKVLELKGRMDAALSGLPSSIAESLSPRLHFVTTPAAEIQGSVGAFFKKKTVKVVGIDRFQEFHHGASMAIIKGGGFVEEIGQAVWLGRYFNYLWETREQLKADEDDVQLVPLFSGQSITENNQTYTAEFPSADEMEGFDTLVADLRVTCGPEGQDCGEWDYEAFIQLCETESCEQVHEIIVWITPYSRPGTKHWLFDLSPFLGLLKEGGERTFRFGMLWNMNPNVLDLNFRLSNRSVGYRSKTVLPLFNGGNFGNDYNDKYEPINVEIPASTVRSELVVIVSGHGQEAGTNCAEWCNHQHEFTINGKTSYTKDHAGEAGTQFGCAERVDDGVPPGQYGNWAPGRAAWCPGLPVHPWIVDLSNDLTPGISHSLTYRGLHQGNTPSGGRIRLNSFLVLYE